MIGTVAVGAEHTVHWNGNQACRKGGGGRLN